MNKLIFDPVNGVQLPQTSAIRAEFEERFKRAFRQSPEDPELNTDPASPMGQILDLLVAEIEAKNAQIAFLANMANPATARGVFLDALGGLYFLERKTSEPTVVGCVLEGTPGAFVPYGAIVKDGRGNRFRHVNAKGVTIGVDGTAKTIFEATTHGALEVPPKSIDKIVSVIAGWQSVTNPVAGVVGRDAETDAEFRERMLASVSINARGSVSALESELKNLDGVIHAVVLENISNETLTEYGLALEPHSVGVCVSGGSDADIAKAIWSKKAGGCGTTGDTVVSHTDVEHLNQTYKYKITRPTPVKFRVKVTFFSKSVGENEKTIVRNAILSDFFGRGENPRIGFASTVYASRFSPVIAKVTQTPIKEVLVSIDSEEFARKATIDATKQPTMTVEDIEILSEEG